MNTKNILITIIVLALLGAGAYYLYQGRSGTQQAGAPKEQVQAQDVTVGTGAEAAPGSVVSVLYIGMLSDGTVFDSSEAHQNQPLVFQLGAPGIIAGFQIGINGMKVGGERVMQIPAALGYGGEDVKDPTSGNIIIPANSTLVFNVKLVKVEAAPAGGATTPEAE